MTRGPGRVLAIDLGQVRIGLALSDPLGVATRPLPALDSTGRKADLNALCDLVVEHGVSSVVIGLPLLLSGDEGPAARSAGARPRAAFVVDPPRPRDAVVRMV